MAVVFPVSSKTLRTRQNTIIAVFMSWGVSLLFSSPALFFHGLVGSRAAANQVITLKIENEINGLLLLVIIETLQMEKLIELYLVSVPSKLIFHIQQGYLLYVTCIEKVGLLRSGKLIRRTTGIFWR